MSIWGPGPFENDDGADWFVDLRDEPSLDSIAEALDEVSDAAHIGYVEVTDAAEAIAAAEVLAELLGSPGDEFALGEGHEQVVEALQSELQGQSGPDIRTLIKQAIDALEVILNDVENSELRQMWEEDAEGMAAWAGAMIRLQQRLRLIAVS